MYVKVVKGTSETTYYCTHVVKHRLDDNAIRVELCGGGPEVPSAVQLPRDADVVYLMSSIKGTMGDTIETIKPRANGGNFLAKPEFRTAVEQER